MGDGGVACMSLQHHHRHHHSIMDKLPDKVILGSQIVGNNGNTAGVTSGTTPTASTAITTSTTAAAGNSAADSTAPGPKKKKVKKVIKKVVTVRKVRRLKSEVAKEKAVKEAGNGDGNHASEKAEATLNDEVEEGELGTLKWPTKELENGDSGVNDNARKSEVVVKKEVVRKLECGKDENSSGKSRPAEVKREEAKVEKRELRWRKTENDNLRDGNFCYSTPRRSMVWRREPERLTPPSSSKFSGDDGFQRKEFGLAASQQSKNPYKWEAGQDDKARLSSKILHSDGSYWDDYTMVADYTTSTKGRRPDEGSRPLQTEHFTERSTERTSRNASASKSSSLENHSLRNFEPSSSSRAVHDRHARSPDRSPRGRARQYGHKERSPFGLERSPHGRDRSPYYNGNIHERSPLYFGTGRDRSPHYLEIGREKSPYSAGRDRSPYLGAGHETSPYYRVIGCPRSPYHQRSPYGRERSPYVRERSPHGRESPRKRWKKRRKDSDNNVKEIQSIPKECHDSSNTHVQNVASLAEKTGISQPEKEGKARSPSTSKERTPCVDLVPAEELVSMEEDMDICDTPPHMPAVPDSLSGKVDLSRQLWVECGPAKLADLDHCFPIGISELFVSSSGYGDTAGKELEIIQEALQMEFAIDQSEDWPGLEALLLRQAFSGETLNKATDIPLGNSDAMSDDFNESQVSGTELAVGDIDSGVWLRGGRSCKGGDWKRNEERPQIAIRKGNLS
ncbi:hypothetical protein MLD38_009143 [Melastoma candidum]|uniref:Uncharacterized protein n=1 Tax=Melastoma candidum TaxID=119954 RepID=A0ACB9S550_9MYRT|nr:hypothetical protein MLD38_009143 [Melastoma candidum]